jgi:ABC-type dipeptide/oligopeptide/nickel transport system permease subunit
VGVGALVLDWSMKLNEISDFVRSVLWVLFAPGVAVAVAGPV